jgi:hypothetical protein
MNEITMKEKMEMPSQDEGERLGDFRTRSRLVQDLRIPSSD